MELIDKAGPDELKVLTFIAERIVELGQLTYGPVNLELDPRNGYQELSEELADALFYVAFEMLRRRHG
jgi:hypothetical protein